MKQYKWKSVAAAAMLFLWNIQTAEAKEAAAEIIPETAAIFSGEANASVLTDGVRSTKWRSDAGSAEFVLPEEAAAIYLEWDFVPEGGWTLRADSVEIEVEQIFLHQYLPLSEPASFFQIEWEGDAILCNVYFLGEGAPPNWVQQWEEPCEKADFLLLPTHADDEHLWFGGVMPLYAGELDCEVQVAYMVNHNTEPYRLHEQLDGLWKVGVENYPVIPDFPDIYSPSLEHARTIYDEEEIVAYQVGLIRRFQPSVIVGHDVNGEYGHGAHCLNTAALMRSVELAADPEAYPETAEQVWDTPKTYLHLYPENEIVMDWDQPLSYFGGKTAFEMAKEGFACHLSQTEYFSVQQSGSYDCRKFGLYRSTVGPDTAADMLQNLPEPEALPESSTQSETILPENTVSSEMSREESVESISQVCPVEQAPQPDSRTIWAVGGASLAALLAGTVLALFRRKRK